MITEQRTGEKAFKLDKELLQSTFTPYKLHLLDKTAKLKNSASLLNNFLSDVNQDQDISKRI